ncbi:MAG: short-subunit dehydrogenase involved in D-alanine esterification of teichoic acids [Chlamydiales bacterium]
MIADFFAEARATAILSDINDELGEKVAKSIPNFHYIQLDVQEENHWKSALEFLSSKNITLDVLLNYARICALALDNTERVQQI